MISRKISVFQNTTNLIFLSRQLNLVVVLSEQWNKQNIQIEQCILSEIVGNETRKVLNMVLKIRKFIVKNDEHTITLDCVSNIVCPVNLSSVT